VTSTYCSGTGSVVSDGACPGSDGDRPHTKTRLARRLAEAGAGKGVSLQGLHVPVSLGVSTVSSLDWARDPELVEGVTNCQE